MIVLVGGLLWLAAHGWWRRTGSRPAWLAGAVVGTLWCTEVFARLVFRADALPTSSARSSNAWVTDAHGVKALERLPVPTALLPMDGRTVARGAAERVLFMGDSFTAGEGVGLGEDLPAQLQTRLTPGTEVLNHGLSGTGFSTQAELFERYSAAWQPDVVVWVFIVNDLGSASPGPALRALSLPGGIDDHIVDRTREDFVTSGSLAWDLGRLMSRRRAVGAVVEQAYRDGYDPSRSGEELRWFRDRLAGMSAALDMRDARLIFVIYPLMHRLQDYPFRDAHATVARLAREAGTQVVDLLPAFEGQDERGLWSSALDHHPNAEAHAIAASRLASYVDVRRARSVCPVTDDVSSGWCGRRDGESALALARHLLAMDERSARSPFEPRKIAGVALHAAAVLGDEAVRAEVEALAEALAAVRAP